METEVRSLRQAQVTGEELKKKVTDYKIYKITWEKTVTWNMVTW